MVSNFATTAKVHTELLLKHGYSVMVNAKDEVSGALLLFYMIGFNFFFNKGWKHASTSGCLGGLEGDS